MDYRKVYCLCTRSRECPINNNNIKFSPKKRIKMNKIPSKMKTIMTSLSTVLSIVMKDIYKECPHLQYRYFDEMYH